VLEGFLFCLLVIKSFNKSELCESRDGSGRAKKKSEIRENEIPTIRKKSEKTEFRRIEKNQRKRNSDDSKKNQKTENGIPTIRKNQRKRNSDDSKKNQRKRNSDDSKKNQKTENGIPTKKMPEIGISETEIGAIPDEREYAVVVSDGRVQHSVVVDVEGEIHPHRSRHSPC
jgi:hypothetical protein